MGTGYTDDFEKGSGYEEKELFGPLVKMVEDRYDSHLRQVTTKQKETSSDLNEPPLTKFERELIEFESPTTYALPTQATKKKSNRLAMEESENKNKQGACGTETKHRNDSTELPPLSAGSEDPAAQPPSTIVLETYLPQQKEDNELQLVLNI